MTQKIQTSLVQEDKKQNIMETKIFPNMIGNRFDYLFNNNYEIIHAVDEQSENYIPIHIDNDGTCHIGVYMTPISKFTMNRIIKYIRTNFKKVQRITMAQSLNYFKGANRTCHWLLECPTCIEDFDKRFSSKTNYNRRYYKRKIETELNCKFVHYNKNSITSDLIKTFWELKKKTESNMYYDETIEPLEWVKSRHITDIYTFEQENNILAMSLFSIFDDTAYCENITYNTNFSKYSIGSVLLYESIKDLIIQKIKNIYFGGGEYKYKKDLKMIRTETNNGSIKIFSLKQFLFSINKKQNNEYTQYKLTFMGIKLSLKRLHKNKLLQNISENIFGNNNLIYSINKKGQKTNCTNIPIDSKLSINGNNNKIIFMNYENQELCKFPQGLDILIEGNNNNIIIYNPRFKNSSIVIAKDNNYFELKETIGLVSGAEIFVSYGGTLKIDENCEIGNGDLYIDIRGDYVNKHKIHIKKDCRLARGTHIRQSDGETVLDPKTLLPCNEPQDIVIGEHCWIGSRCIILKGVTLPNNTVVGANSLVNKKFINENTLIAGSPAKVIKDNYYWQAGTYAYNMSKLEKDLLDDEIKYNNRTKFI